MKACVVCEKKDIQITELRAELTNARALAALWESRYREFREYMVGRLDVISRLNAENITLSNELKLYRNDCRDKNIIGALDDAD